MKMIQDKELLFSSIEDIAFALWDGDESPFEFAGRFLIDYPGFHQVFSYTDLGRLLQKRL